MIRPDLLYPVSQKIASQLYSGLSKPLYVETTWTGTPPAVAGDTRVTPTGDIRVTADADTRVIG